MKAINVKRLFAIRQHIKELQEEEEELKNKIKEEMLRTKMEEVTIENICVRLKTQHRIEVDDNIVPFLKQKGYTDLIIEKCDQVKFKERLTSGQFAAEYASIKDYLRTRDIYYLYLKSKLK